MSHVRRPPLGSVTHPEEAAPATDRPALAGVRADHVRPLAVATHLGAGLALLWWAFPLTRAGGGTEPFALTAALLSLIPLLVATRVWTLKRRFVALALTPGLVLAALAPWSMTGWSGLLECANWLYAGLLGLGVLGYARTPKRKLLVVAVVALAGLDQFGQGWVAWWGGGNTSDLMSGNFGWHNPFAAFMAAPFIVGCVLAARSHGTVRLAAVLTVPWVGAGLLLSGSRATTGLVILAVVAIATFTLRRPSEWAWFGGAVLSAPLVAWLLSSPWLMSDGGSVATTAAGRPAGGSNFLLRGFYDLAGLRLASQNVATGTGVDTFGSAGSQYMPADVAASDLVHNGWIQALVDGGLVLAIPVVLVTAIPALRSLRRIFHGRRLGANGIQVGASAALLVLLGHALFDYDWQYPSLLALYAILAALLPWRAWTPTMAHRRWAVVAVISAAGLCALAASALGTSVRFPEGESPRWLTPVSSFVNFSEVTANLHTSTSDRDLLARAETLDEATFAAVMARTERLAALDPGLAQTRALAVGQRGDTDQMLTMSAAELPADPRPPVILGRGEVLWLSGDQAQARTWVQTHYDRLAGLQGNVPLADLEQWLRNHPARAAAEAEAGAEG